MPPDHPLRAIRQLVNAALDRLSPAFAAIDADGGRLSVAPEKLLRTLLQQVLFSIRSERQLMEQRSVPVALSARSAMPGAVFQTSTMSLIAFSYCRHTAIGYIGGMKTIDYTAAAARDLKRHGSMVARIRRALEEYAAAPIAHANNVTPMVGTSGKRMRVGSFRVLFQETETRLLVTKVAPRGSAYD